MLTIGGDIMPGLILFIVILLIIAIPLLRGNRKIVVIENGKRVNLQKSMTPKTTAIIAIILIIAAFVAVSIRVIPVGHAMVKFNIITKKFSVSHEGITLVPPFIYKTYIYDLRRQDYTMTARKGEGKKANIDDSLWSPTKEGLQVGIDLTCWYRINPDSLISVHRRIGPDYDEKVIRPAIRGIVRLVISEYPIMDVYSAKRQEIQQEIFKRVKRLLEPDGFTIEEIVLRDVHFTKDFAKAIEQKQIAQQEAERMKYVLEKEQLEAQRKAIEAKGKAKAIQIVSQELKRNPLYIKYLYVDKLSDKVKVIVADQPTIMDLKGLIESQQ